jgi:ribonuclease ZC3H12
VIPKSFVKTTLRNDEPDDNNCRYIVQYAAISGGVVVSNDSYTDLLNGDPAIEETIRRRKLAFTFVGDVIMFPEDPLGRHGPRLKEFLSF